MRQLLHYCQALNQPQIPDMPFLQHQRAKFLLRQLKSTKLPLRQSLILMGSLTFGISRHFHANFRQSALLSSSSYALRIKLRFNLLPKLVVIIQLIMDNKSPYWCFIEVQQSQDKSSLIMHQKNSEETLHSDFWFTDNNRLQLIVT